MRGNASGDALRHDFKSGRRASRAAFPRGAWERSPRAHFLGPARRIPFICRTFPRKSNRLVSAGSGS
ncbi:DUF1534 domain-containing protein [Pseudomonas sp. SXM-1]|nr:DUF1534 domain-containing protein [Pseudomonas sp. SXM-1]